MTKSCVLHTHWLLIPGLGIGSTLLVTKLVSGAAAKALKEAEERQQLQQQQRQDQ
jgi:hypothetical protein